MIALETQSIGSPPNRHADHIVSAMMKYLTKEHAKLWQAIYGITKDPRVMDGNPRAQQKLADKVKTAGAIGVLLIPGKRWRYRMGIYCWRGNCHLEIEITI